MKISFGYSPCPNDTYMFGPIAKGLVGLDGYDIIPVIRDVDTLNLMAIEGKLDISKLSFHSFFKVKKSYQLLYNGGAMGFGCGPVLISKKKIDKNIIRDCRVVLPGELTTAHLLFRLWQPAAKDRIFTTYDKIFYYLNNDLADCGVVIHESRFTFKNLGFRLSVDLGSWWEKITKLPVPLGCIVARKTMGATLLNDLDNMIHLSIKEAKSNLDYPYVRKYAQEMSDDVLSAHINTFVNEYSLGYRSIGLKAIKELYLRASKSGLL